MSKIYLKKADWKDVDLLFKWVNDEEVRKNSFNSHKIDYEEHKQWYKSSLEDRNVDIFILYVNNTPIGQIRLNYSGTTAIINYSIDKNYRRKGFGSIILKMVEQKVIYSRPEILVLLGSVKPNNIPSKKVFEKNGYEKKFVKNKGNSYFLYKKEIRMETE